MAKKKEKIKQEEFPTRTAYILMNKSFEYDDNYYNQNEGGSPVKTYLIKERADEECAKANIVELATTNLFDYSYNLREGGDSVLEELKSTVKEHKGKVVVTEDGYDVKVKMPDTATNKQIDEILRILEIEFNSVVEIELEMFMG